jgi:hypothetical protein
MNVRVRILAVIAPSVPMCNACRGRDYVTRPPVRGRTCESYEDATLMATSASGVPVVLPSTPL